MNCHATALIRNELHVPALIRNELHVTALIRNELHVTAIIRNNWRLLIASITVRSLTGYMRFFYFPLFEVNKRKHYI